MKALLDRTETWSYVKNELRFTYEFNDTTLSWDFYDISLMDLLKAKKKW